MEPVRNLELELRGLITRWKSNTGGDPNRSQTLPYASRLVAQLICEMVT